MTGAVRIIRVTTGDGAVAEPDWLRKSETVFRELRPQIPADYVGKMQAIFAGGGRMIVAVAGDDVVGLAMYRTFEDTYNGKRLYCDDLVTTEAQRSTGVGHALMQFMEAEARTAHCTAFTLDSGL